MIENLGWPVVSAKNCFNVIRECGIKPWKKTKESAVDEYLTQASEAQIAEYRRFGPTVKVGTYENPNSLEPYNGFRTAFKPCAMVFALIDGYIPITAEWKHGNEKITLCPVAGVPGKAEKDLSTLHDQLYATAFREWREETGIELETVVPLGPRTGVWALVRSVNCNYFPFVGIVREPVVKMPAKFDDNEQLQMVMFPTREWLTLLEDYDYWDNNAEFGVETYARDTTYAALRWLGRLSFVE